MQVDNEAGTILVSQGDARLKVKFLQRGQIDIDQFTGFPYPPEYRGGTTPDYKDQWHLTASTTGKRSKANFITLLVPYKKDRKPVIHVSGLAENENQISFWLTVNEEKLFCNT